MLDEPREGRSSVEVNQSVPFCDRGWWIDAGLRAFFRVALAKERGFLIKINSWGGVTKRAADGSLQVGSINT